MSNDIDDRDPTYGDYDAPRRHRRSQQERDDAYGSHSQYAETDYGDEQAPEYQDQHYDYQEDHDAYAGGSEQYAEHGEAQDPNYEQYDDYDQEQDAGYQDREPAPVKSRNRMVPVLAGVATVLVVAIAAVVGLYFFGFFSGDQPPLSAETADGTETMATMDAPQPPAAGDAPRTIDLAPNATNVPAPASSTPQVRDASVDVAPVLADQGVRSTYGDWQMRCDTPAGAQNEQCILMQFVTASDRDNVGLSVIILKTADGQARLMRVLAPLGVLITEGLGLTIDETTIGRTLFVRCLPNGCVAEVNLEGDLLTQLSNGTTATFVIFQTPEEGIGIPISLAGFQEGFQALQ